MLGGAQRQLVELLKGADRSRYAIEVISLSTEKIAYADAIRELGIPLTLIAQRGTWSWSAFFALHRALRRARPAIVHTWLFTADFYGRLAAKLAGVRRIISTVRSVETDKPTHYVAVDRLLRRWTDGFIVNAKAVGDMLVQREQVPPAKLRLIYNGIDLKRLDPATTSAAIHRLIGARETAPLVGIVGRLAPVKDHETFLRAARLVTVEMPETHFLIVGTGRLNMRLRELTRFLALESWVHFLPNQADVASIYAALDLLVVSSRYEGCSNVILEAMALSRPVVATAVGGNPELVSPETGRLVPPQHPEALARTIVELLRNPVERRALGAAARRRIEERFSLARMVRETEAVYEELMEDAT